MSTHYIQDTYIVEDEGICGGKPRIEGTRMKVQLIAFEYEHMGMTPDQICDAHPHLTLAQVHAAISYYYAHKADIDNVIREDHEYAEKIRKELTR